MQLTCNLCSLKKKIYVTTEISNEEATELQELNNENNQDTLHGPMPWMGLCYYTFEQMELILHRSINN